MPPVFKQQAADMIQARSNHEQAMEKLRLMYVAARRREQQMTHAEAARRRESLQLRSQQLLPCAGPPIQGPATGKELTR